MENNNKEGEIKVFILTIPLYGHVIPILKVANELINNKKIKVVIYSTENFKKKCEKIGAEFRNYEGINGDDMKIKIPFNRRTILTPQLIKKLQIIIDFNLIKITKEIDNEKPNAILFEFIALHAKYVVRLLNENFYKTEELNRSISGMNTNIPTTTTATPVILYSTFFINEKNIYPNKFEKSIKNNISGNEKLKARLNWSTIRLKSYKLSKKFKLSYRDPLKESYEIDPNLLNIVLTFPELQPRSHLFQKNNRFVGSCINDIVDDEFVDTTKLIKPFLSNFKSKNPLTSVDDFFLDDRKLVYVSLGTIFKDNVPSYLSIINAFKDDDSFGFSIEKLQLHIIVSVGKKCYEIFNEMLENNELKLAHNMIVVPCGPQIEILKRASLFITQASLNSISDSIYYGVPMVCITITSDQPVIAYRICTELGLGVTLDFLNLKSSYVRAVVLEIFRDATYVERCLRYSKISRDYDGPKNAADIVENFILESMKI